MPKSDSDGEFERFLAEDEDSSSPDPTPRKTKPGAYTASSASAVTAAAAALLASSKLTKKLKNKKKSRSMDKKSKKAAAKQLSESEEAPPSYYPDSATGASYNADPYAFDMAASAFSLPNKDEDEKSMKRKKKEREVKPIVKKAPAESMEDRIAKILQRTGSTQFQASEVEKSDEDELSSKITSENEAKVAAKSDKNNIGTAQNHTGVDQEENDNKDESSDEERSSLFDSLRVESADFEVHIPPKPSTERPRLSLTSLDSEKFVVNREALGSGLATPSRYEQQQITFLKSEQGEDSGTEKDDYEYEGFELDRSTTEDQDLPPPYSLDSDQTRDNGGGKTEEPYVSQFDAMKALLLADSVSPIANEAAEGKEEAPYNAYDDTKENHDSSGSFASAEMPQVLESNDTFGYGDDDFEETEGSKMGEDSRPKPIIYEPSPRIESVSKPMVESEDSVNYEDDDFEDGPTEGMATATLQAKQEEMENKPRKSRAFDDTDIDRAARVDTLLAAQYGDFYTVEDTGLQLGKDTAGDTAQQNDEPQQPTQGIGDLLSGTTVIPGILATPLNQAESPPSSPPPPPPPAEDDDHEFHHFSLDSGRESKGKTQTVAAQNAIFGVSTREAQLKGLSATDRFHQIESRVASLRFIQPTNTAIGNAFGPGPAQVVYPVSAKVLSERQDDAPPASSIEPLAISFDEGLLVEDEETQFEIDEFVRSSQILRQEHREAVQRANMARENGLVLRLQQAQRQILQLKEHIQATAGSDPPVGTSRSQNSQRLTDKKQDDATDLRSSAGGDATALSQAAYGKLQNEIKTQDNLIAAFQKENERLMQQLKQVRQDVQYDVHEANEELRRQMKRLQVQNGEGSSLGGGDNASIARYLAAVEARLEAEAHAMALQEELAAVRLSHQQKVNELTLELDRVRKAKVELECRYEGVDLVQVAQETQHAREKQNELVLCKKEHAHALAALQKKLDWYVENQRLLDDQDEELRRLRREVAGQSLKAPPTALKNERPNAQGGPSPARSHRRSPNDIRRIQELESRLAELEEAMRRRHPDSLANLILASRRADDESKTSMLENDYQEKLAALSRELEQAHETSETKLASFRQQQEKLLLQYHRKIKEQEKQLKQLSKAPLSHKTPSREATKSATSEAELTRVRRFYTEKIKQLERKWGAKYRSQRKQQFTGLSRSDSNQHSHQQDGLTYADSAVVIASLQRHIRELEVEVKQERGRADQLEADSLVIPGSTAFTEDPLATEDTDLKRREQKLRATANELEEYVSDLEAQLRESESARSRLAHTLTTVHNLGTARASVLEDSTKETASTTKSISVPVASTTGLSESQQIEFELAQLRQDLDSAQKALSTERGVLTEKITKLDGQVFDLVGKNTALQTQLTDSQRELKSLQKLAIEAERHNRSLGTQARRVPTLEEEVLSLRRELELPRTPSMVQYRSLELKVATLEQKHKLREAELKVVLDRALASSNLERLSREHAHRAAIAAKNAEIASFKRQLEEIIDELAQLQLPSSSRQLSTELEVHSLNDRTDNVRW